MAPGPVIRPQKAKRIVLTICLLARNASTLLQTYSIPTSANSRCGIVARKADIFWARLIAAELYNEVVPAGMSP